MVHRQAGQAAVEPESRDSLIVVKVANLREREIALSRRAEIYQKELGYHGIDEHDRNAVHLVAIDRRGEIVGAARMLGPSPLPLELDEFVAIPPFFPPGGVAMQLGGLWVSKEKKDLKSRFFTPLALWRRILEIAVKTRTKVLIVRTLPRLAAYYKTVGFRSFPGGPFHDPTWGRVALMFQLLPAESELVEGAGRDPSQW